MHAVTKSHLNSGTTTKAVFPYPSGNKCKFENQRHLSHACQFTLNFTVEAVKVRLA
jgi:hypothetical protein